MDVKPEETSRFGIVLTDEDGRVTGFMEKPKEAPSTLANMGVYVFRVDALIERLQALAPKHKDLDFGKHVIPSMLDRYTLQSYPFAGYWVDVGTVDAYWTTSMELISGHSQLNLYDPDWVIHTRSEERAPAKVGPQSRVQESMICNGSFVRGQVMRSVLSPGVYVSPGAVVRESVIMNDTWIGPGAVVDRCIVDKNVVVEQVRSWASAMTWTRRTPRPRTGSTPARPSSAKAHTFPAACASGATSSFRPMSTKRAFASFGDTVPSGSTVAEGASWQLWR